MASAHNNEEDIREFQKAISEGKTGTATLDFNGEFSYLCFMPLESSKDWYITTVVPEKVLLGESIIVQRLIRLVIAVFGVTLICAAIAFVIWWGRKTKTQEAYYREVHVENELGEASRTIRLEMIPADLNQQIAVLKDITSDKEIQESLIVAMERVETANYAKNDFLSQMIKRGYMDPGQALETVPREGDGALLKTGKCAFICIELSAVQDFEDAPFEVMVTGVPVLPEGIISVYGANSRLCIDPNSKHLDTALDFVEMIGTKEALGKSAELDGVLSSAKDGATDIYPEAEQLAELLQQPGQIPNQDFALHFNTWESIRDVGREISSGISVDEACNMLDEKQREDLVEFMAE